MRLVLESEIPNRRYLINDRIDGGDPIVRNGQTFEVEDYRGRFLVSRYFPELKPAP